MRLLVLMSSAALSATTLGLVTSCGDAAPRSTEQFCGELTAHADEIRTPPAEPDDIPALITLFSKMGEVAPLDIAADWETIYGSLKTANTVNVADPASVQLVTNAAFATQKSAENVVAWAQTNCGLDLGPVGIAAGGVEVAPPPVDTTPTSG